MQIKPYPNALSSRDLVDIFCSEKFGFALDSTKNLLNRIQTKKVILRSNTKIYIKDEELESLKIISNTENEVCISYEKSKTNMEELINLIKSKNIKIIDISTDDGDLEDVFLRLIKN